MQVLLNGLISGSTLALLALAFTVVYLPTSIFYVALGAIYAVAPFITWECLKHGWPWYLAVATSILISIFLSIACDLINHKLLEYKRASPGAHLISSLGIYILIVELTSIVWGSEPKILRTEMDSVTKVANLVITQTQLTAVAVSAMILIGFYLWLRFSNLGLQFRALADNSAEMALKGYNVSRLRIVAFGLSGFLASVAALIVAFDLGFNPHGGLSALLLAVVSVIIGGRHSFIGPFVGGLLLGILRSEVVWFLSARWQDAVPFLLLAAFLLLRPNGLIGRQTRLEAET
jgi:branched-chain amino acid transport system permease protein